MYIINETYFNKTVNRPEDGSDLYAGYESDSNTFEAWIDEYSRLCLQNALGNVLFSDFDGYVNDNGDLEGAPDKWNNLVDGTDFVYGSKTYTWKGLKVVNGKSKTSLLADYVYSQWYLKTQLSYLSNMGEASGNAINSSRVSGNTRYYKTFNRFVRAYQGDMKYHRDYRIYWDNLFNRSIYNDMLLGRYRYTDDDNGYVSLLDFLTMNSEDYTDASRKLYKKQNFLGI